MNAVTQAYIKTQLGSNSSWAIKALTKIYSLQTYDEQVCGNTHNLNGVGFSGCDAEILSSFAKQINNGRTLSNKQMAIVFKKMPRYHKQIMQFIPAEKLADLEAKAKKAQELIPNIST